MKKIIISVLLGVTMFTVAGCGSKEPIPAAETYNISWEQVENNIFNGTLGHMELIDKINKSNFSFEIKEDLKAIVYQIVVYDGRVTGVKEEAQKLWGMREENPDTFIYDYQMQQEENK